MPLGSQEEATPPQALQRLRAERGTQALPVAAVVDALEDVLRRYDSEAAADVIGLVATRLLGITGAYAEADDNTLR